MKIISIIIPFYKGLNYLDDCFESILEQNLDSEDYEVICMGDSPEEGIVSKIEQYESKGLPIRYVQWFENHGTGYTRNMGLSMAEGEYVYFLDCDDYIIDGCLNRLLDCAIANNADVVRGGIVNTFDNKEIFSQTDILDSDNIPADKKGTDTELARMFAGEISVLNMLIKKNVIENSDIKFAEEVVYFTDMPFVMKLMSKVDNYYIVSDALLAKRLRNDNNQEPSLNQQAKANSENMISDLMKVYEASISFAMEQPKRKNLIMYILCKNVLSAIYDGWKVSDDVSKKCAKLLGEAIKNVSVRFDILERCVLIFASMNRMSIAKIFAKLSGSGRMKNGNGIKSLIRKIIKRGVVFGYYIMNTICPVNKKRVVLSSSLGKSYSGNPKAIYEKMVSLGLDKEYECIWFYEKHPFDIPGVNKQVKFGRMKYLFYMATANFWIFDARQPEFLRKRNRVTYLQTWHGTPLKKLALDMDNVYMAGEDSIEAYKDGFRKNALTWDYLISQNPFSTETFRRAFDYKGKMLETGYPRNDVLFSQNNTGDIKMLKKSLGLPDDKVVFLYAPTWRDDAATGIGKYHFSNALSVKKMYEAFGDRAVLIIKYHYLVEDNIDWSEYSDFVYMFDQSVDIASLYLVSDILITDYSSVMFDYSLLKRPMYFYCYDIEKYKNVLRGFYFDFEKSSPGPISETTEELIEHINNNVADDYAEKYETFCNQYNPWDKGTASVDIINELFGS